MSLEQQVQNAIVRCHATPFYATKLVIALCHESIARDIEAERDKALTMVKWLSDTVAHLAAAHGMTQPFPDRPDLLSGWVHEDGSVCVNEAASNHGFWCTTHQQRFVLPPVVARNGASGV